MVSDTAVKHHEDGKNCTQSILLSLSELDETTAVRIASGFGSGMKCGEICGCISGAYMALGLAEADPKSYKKYLNGFKKKFGCIHCSELKANKISCNDLISYTAKAVNKIIGEK